MKKTVSSFAAVCAVTLIAFGAAAPAVLAQESGSTALTTSGVTTADLGVERPGLLPSNPLYFFKEWTRGIRRTFTVDPVRRAEYELQVATEKAAELKRLDEVRGEPLAVLRAAENYAENMRRLTLRLEALTETSENPNVDRLLDSLVARSLLHQELLGELKAKYGSVKDGIEEVQKAVDGALTEVSRTLDDPDAFAKRFERAVKERTESPVKELNAINILNRLNADLPEEVQRKVRELKDDLVLRFQGKVGAVPVSPAELERFAGDASERVLVIDEVRERVLDNELKNSLGQLRERLLKEAEGDGRIGERDAMRMIQSAEELAERLAAQIRELGARSPVSARQLLERVNANIEQAKTFYAAGQFGAAFGQATSAVSGAKNAMTQFALRAQDSEKNILELKQEFDELQALARRAELSRERNLKIFALFGEAEQMIVSLGSRWSLELARETKALLGTIESAIREILEPRTEKPAPDREKEGIVCIQVIQPANDPASGVCKEFPTPCDVPLGWVAVNACEKE